VKKESEGEELVGRRAPSPPEELVRVPSWRNDDMSLGSLGWLGGLEPSKPSMPSPDKILSVFLVMPN
jgi:hypothetical protein